MERPARSEYHDYYGTYIDQVPDGAILTILEEQIGETVELLSGVDEQTAGSRYEPGKWSVREVVGHLADSERLFVFRALWFARQDPSPLPGMDPDDWMAAADLEHRPLAEIVEEFRLVRLATLAFFGGLSPDGWARAGTASERRFTVRSLAWIVAGHEVHHRRVLRERYLVL